MKQIKRLSAITSSGTAHRKIVRIGSQERLQVLSNTGSFGEGTWSGENSAIALKTGQSSEKSPHANHRVLKMDAHGQIVTVLVVEISEMVMDTVNNNSVQHGCTNCILSLSFAACQC
jgi:hypothetical protein